MKVLVINGSPRKNANTATLLEHAVKGASRISRRIRRNNPPVRFAVSRLYQLLCLQAAGQSGLGHLRHAGRSDSSAGKNDK